jgi:receptor protein-tyrosine kinase
VTAEALRRAGLMVGGPEGLRSRLSEEISVLQQNLLRTLRTIEPARDRVHRAILITSACPGEGKSFTSLNVAASMAAGGTPVLLVDADGKRDSLSKLLGVQDRPGLRLLASGTPVDPRSLPLQTALPQLQVLPYGAADSDQAAIPPGKLVADALLRLAAAVPDRVLIIDSPPCLSTSDPSSLAAVVGQVLMVVQAERTQRNEVEAALDMVDACPLLQLALNRLQINSLDSFGGYGGYYGDGYGYYRGQAAAHAVAPMIVPKPASGR